MDKKRVVIAVDAGSTGIRVLCLDEAGAILARAYKRVPSVYPEEGAIEQEPETIWSVFHQVVHEALGKVPGTAEPVSIGISVQRATFCLVDRNSGKEITNFISWSDQRAVETAEQMNSRFRWKVLKAGAKVISLFTGSKMMTATSMLTFVTEHVITRLVWLFRRKPELKTRAEAGELLFCTLESWFVYKLTEGAVHATDYSNAGATSLFNPFEKKWNPIFCGLFDIPMNMFPRVLETAADYGETSFLGRPVKIGAVVGDQMAALFGHGCFSPGEVKISMGTGAFVDINAGPVPKLSRRGLFPLIGWKINGRTTYMLEGTVTAVGRLIDWLGPGIGLSEDPLALNAYAGQCDTSRGVIYVPTPSGIRFPHFNAQVRSSIFGLSLSTKRCHVARAVLEGIAFRLTEILMGIEADTRIPITRVKVDGGVSKSDILVQRLADFSGHTIERSHESEVSALGAGYLAGLAADVWENEGAVKALPREYDHFSPAIGREEREEQLKRWSKAVKAAISMGKL